jgi:hypothetical protein
MAKPKQDIHREWFRTVSCGNRKSCPNCKVKLEPDESIWSWGNYIRAKWHTIGNFCKNCYEERVAKPMIAHSGPCGCVFEYVGYQGTKLPTWMVLPSECAVKNK